MFTLAVVVIGLMVPALASAQVVYPTKAAPQVVESTPQGAYVTAAPQAYVPATTPSTSLAPTPPLAATPVLLTTAPAVSMPAMATPQTPCQPMASPQATPQASSQLGGPNCACYYPQGYCPFPSGNCAFPRGNCVAPAGSCVGGPCPTWPQGSPQVSPQVSPQTDDLVAIPRRTASRK